ncbi:hypothetical protein [Bosea sp. UC22_33]|uniref:hypothetical protein n=1 Tax=Bosea sp. UC22_33 TaxID=3350165 RepID=UPI003670B360
MSRLPSTLLEATNHLHETIFRAEAASMATHAIECDAHRNALGTAIDAVADRLRDMHRCISELLRQSRAVKAHG